jgi:hypothetical protein
MSPHAVSRRKFLGYVGTALGGYAILRPNVAGATSDLEGSDQQDAIARSSWLDSWAEDALSNR